MKNIIVTGTSKGIGYEIVQLLSKDSDNHIIALSRNTESLKKLGLPNVYIQEFDLIDFNQSVIEQIKKEFGEIHILINNAGLLLKQPFAELDDKEWFKSFQVNFFGVVKLIRLCLPQMGKTHKAHIVNIGSMGGFQGSVKFAGLSAYSTAKAALANLTEALAVELIHQNIAINCLSLGSVETEMFHQAFPQAVAQVKSSQIAEYIVWFASQGQYFHNGKIIPVALSTP
jgi:NAD(P)-dependent dehydrogenase (short-subunit alcohol dehydrogenase family)